MLMRGQSVPDARKWYIFHDTKREAIKLGISYGFIAGLDWPKAKALLADRSWREWAEDNRKTMYGCGLWSVPSFRYGTASCWGQDRLWVIEDEIKSRYRL